MRDVPTRIPTAQLVRRRSAVALLLLCAAVSVLTSVATSCLVERTSQRDIGEVANATRAGFDALDGRLRAVELRCE